MGSSPSWGDNFFMKSGIKCALLIYSNTLEIINQISDVRTTWKLKKIIKEMSKIVITIVLSVYILFNILRYLHPIIEQWCRGYLNGLLISRSWVRDQSKARPFLFFFSILNETKGEEICVPLAWAFRKNKVRNNRL